MLGITNVTAGTVPIGARFRGILPEGVSEGKLRGAIVILLLNVSLV